MVNIIIDIETIANERINEYKQTFEPAKPEPEPEEEPVVEINPKTGKPKRAKAKPKPKSEGRAKSPKSAKPGLHWLTGRVICVGVKPDGKEPVMFADDDEEKLLVALHEYLLARFPYTIVTYNGKSFDQPFLVMRGMLYGLDFASLLPSDRYSKSHVDLFEMVGSGKWALPCKLSEAAWFFGIPAVVGSGSEVQEQYDKGDIDGIIDHCKSDIETTEKLFHIVMGKKQRKMT